MRLLSTFCSLLPFGLLLAQVPRFYGVTPIGGANDKGIIFHVNGDGSGYGVDFAFDELSGYAPEGGLCLAPNGMLYGMTNLGGAGTGSASGTLYKFDPSGGGFTKLVDFDLLGGNGAFGWATMIAADDGMLYGATYGGGGGSGGSLFRLDPSDDSYTIIKALDQATDGGSITDALIQGADGKLYGSCGSGGANGYGTLFRYDIGSGVYTKLHDFDGVDGRTPYGALCQAGNGTLYGMTYRGGSADNGVFYRIETDGSGFAKLFDFTGTNGQSPWNHMVVASPDLLYGAVSLGGSNSSGLLFSFVPSTSTFTEIYGFGVLEGGLLFGSPVLASDGKLYGMGASGGAFFYGSVYRYDPVSDVSTTLHSFQPPDGYSPRGDLVQVGMATGVSELAGAQPFRLWPQPTTGAFTLELFDAAWIGATATISNSIGQSVATYRISDLRTSMELQQPAGMYLLTLSAPQRSASARLMMER